jgi:hypothetical protein
MVAQDLAVILVRVLRVLVPNAECIMTLDGGAVLDPQVGLPERADRRQENAI